MLEVSGLRAGYGPALIVDQVAFRMQPAECVALLGRNGAGKSTTLKALMGLLGRTEGQVRFQGEGIEALPPHQRARRGLGYVPEERRIFTGLSVAENLEVGRQPPRQGAPHWTISRVFELFPSLGRLRGRAGGALSGGEQQMLAVARTLMGNPALLLLDEPFEGLAPLLVERMAEAIASLKGEGLGVLLSEQNLRFARRIAPRALVLDQGRLCFDGPLATLDGDERLRARHLAV